MGEIVVIAIYILLLISIFIALAFLIGKIKEQDQKIRDTMEWVDSRATLLQDRIDFYGDRVVEIDNSTKEQIQNAKKQLRSEFRSVNKTIIRTIEEDE